MQLPWLEAMSYSSRTGKAFLRHHGHRIIPSELQLNPFGVSTQRQVWRTTGATLGQSMGAHLQNINAHVNAAYAYAGMLYIFSCKAQLCSLQPCMASLGFNFSLLPGDRYFVVQQLKMQMLAPPRLWFSLKPQTSRCCCSYQRIWENSLVPLITGTALTRVLSQVIFMGMFRFWFDLSAKLSGMMNAGEGWIQAFQDSSRQTGQESAERSMLPSSYKVNRMQEMITSFIFRMFSREKSCYIC